MDILVDVKESIDCIGGLIDTGLWYTFKRNYHGGDLCSFKMLQNYFTERFNLTNKANMLD